MIRQNKKGWIIQPNLIKSYFTFPPLGDFPDVSADFGGLFPLFLPDLFPVVLGPLDGLGAEFFAIKYKTIILHKYRNKN
ncbi:hypothetical protein EZS27_013150 [termite gut metagenome]|uniref:Uncharacterized protein n=1 Tax=termite gut metagenome TaxID=433724 RepID=A0A5J4RY92_9ZZZZ